MAKKITKEQLNDVNGGFIHTFCKEDEPTKYNVEDELSKDPNLFKDLGPAKTIFPKKRPLPNKDQPKK